MQLVDAVSRLAMLGRDGFTEAARRRVVRERDVVGPAVPERVDVVIDRCRVRRGEIDGKNEVAVGGEFAEIRLLVGAQLPVACARRDLLPRIACVEPDQSGIFRPAEERQHGGKYTRPPCWTRGGLYSPPIGNPD
jgi:hypothetical protein